jgi:hypothetical protein
VVSFVRGIWMLAAALALVIVVRPSEAASRHPIHSTLTEVRSLASGAAEISVRVFADDFSAAVSRHARRTPRADHVVDDSAAFAYTMAALRVRDRAGRAVALAWCGSRRTGDVVWLCLRSTMPVALGGLEIQNRLHADLYTDQINIVQATYSGRRESLLFTVRDGVKRLP